MEYSENTESSGGSQRTRTELLVTFSIVRFLGGCGTETKKNTWYCMLTAVVPTTGHPCLLGLNYSSVLYKCVLNLYMLLSSEQFFYTNKKQMHQ
jgi:hypothetical protein